MQNQLCLSICCHRLRCQMHRPVGRSRKTRKRQHKKKIEFVEWHLNSTVIVMWPNHGLNSKIRRWSSGLLRTVSNAWCHRFNRNRNVKSSSRPKPIRNAHTHIISNFGSIGHCTRPIHTYSDAYDRLIHTFQSLLPSHTMAFSSKCSEIPLLFTWDVDTCTRSRSGTHYMYTNN